MGSGTRVTTSQQSSHRRAGPDVNKTSRSAASAVSQISHTRGEITTSYRPPRGWRYAQHHSHMVPSDGSMARHVHSQQSATPQASHVRVGAARWVGVHQGTIIGVSLSYKKRWAHSASWPRGPTAPSGVRTYNRAGRSSVSPRLCFRRGLPGTPAQALEGAVRAKHLTEAVGIRAQIEEGLAACGALAGLRGMHKFDALMRETHHGRPFHQ